MFTHLQAFVETTEHTLQAGFVRNDMHLLLCEDDVWQNWVNIMRQYARGQLPNTKGETQSDTPNQSSKIPTMKGGKIQQAPGTVTLGPTLFRCISGLEKIEVLSLQKAILDRSILLKKSKTTLQRVDMEEMAWQIKTDRVLTQAIVSFFYDLTREFLTWEQVCSQYKLGDYEYKQLRSYSQSYVKDCLNRSKKNPSLPTSVVTLLNHLYRVSMGIISQRDSIPWKVRGVGFDMDKITSFCGEELIPFQLVVLDLHGTRESLSVEFFSSLTSALNTLNSQYEYIIVCFIDFIHIGMLIEGVSSQSTKLHYEFGIIDTQREDAWTAQTIEIATVALFVSKVNTFGAINKVLTQKVSMRGFGGKKDFVDRDFIDDLITGFCPEQSYVLEIYCGGLVLEQSLLQKRRCIALCKDEFEALELEARCSAMMESDPSLQEWCGVEANLEKQVVQLDEEDKDELDNIGVDIQPSGEDEDDDEGDVREVGDVGDFEYTKWGEEDVADNKDTMVVEYVEDANDDDEEPGEHEVENANEVLTAKDPTNTQEGDGVGGALDTNNYTEGENDEVSRVVESDKDLGIKDTHHAHGPSQSERVQGRKVH